MACAPRERRVNGTTISRKPLLPKPRICLSQALASRAGIGRVVHLVPDDSDLSNCPTYLRPPSTFERRPCRIESRSSSHQAIRVRERLGTVA